MPEEGNLLVPPPTPIHVLTLASPAGGCPPPNPLPPPAAEPSTLTAPATSHHIPDLPGHSSPFSKPGPLLPHRPAGRRTSAAHSGLRPSRPSPRLDALSALPAGTRPLLQDGPVGPARRLPVCSSPRPVHGQGRRRRPASTSRHRPCCVCPASCQTHQAVFSPARRRWRPTLTERVPGPPSSVLQRQARQAEGRPRGGREGAWEAYGTGAGHRQEPSGPTDTR